MKTDTKYGLILLVSISTFIIMGNYLPFWLEIVASPLMIYTGYLIIQKSQREEEAMARLKKEYEDA